MTRKSAKLPKKTLYDWPRRKCRHCQLLFKPRPDQYGETQKFCCPNHRKEYEKYGRMPLDKIAARVLKMINEKMSERLDRLAARIEQIEHERTIEAEIARNEESAA